MLWFPHQGNLIKGEVYLCTIKLLEKGCTFRIQSLLVILREPVSKWLDQIRIGKCIGIMPIIIHFLVLIPIINRKSEFFQSTAYKKPRTSRRPNFLSWLMSAETLYSKPTSSPVPSQSGLCRSAIGPSGISRTRPIRINLNRGYPGYLTLL